jgi:uncharacterized membrane protein
MTATQEAAHQHPAAAVHGNALAGLQAPIIMMSQNRAAARDELLAQHHYDETRAIDQLLQANVDLTKQVHDLTQKVHVLTEHLCNTSGIGAG